MAAQVEVQTGEVGRAVTAGRPYLSPLTDSSNTSIMEIPAINQPRRISPEPNKPVPGPKPRLTPKPFAVEKNPTIKPILAPKPQPKPRPESTRLPGHKPELPSGPKPPQPSGTGKPRPSSTNPNRPASTSFRTPTKLNSGQTSKPVVHPFKPAPPLEPLDLSKPPVPAGKPAASGLVYSKSLKSRSAAEWAGTTKKENPHDQSGTSITRAKSMGFLAQVGQQEDDKDKDKAEAAVAMRAQSRGSRPRPVSAIFLNSPTKTEAPTPAPRWERRPLSADLTSKFESPGLTVHNKTPKTSAKESTPESGAPEPDKKPSIPPPSSADPTAKPAASEPPSNKKSEETSGKEAEEETRVASIKSRISLLLDASVSSQAPTTSVHTPDLVSPEQQAPGNEAPVGVKERIKQLTEDNTPNQSPAPKPALKPRPLPLDLTKRFTPERSPDFGSVSLSEATERHEASKDPPRRMEESVTTPSDPRASVDFPEQQKASVSETPEAGQAFGAAPGQSAEVQTVRASLFDNVVERHNVQMLDEGQPASWDQDLLSSPSFRRGGSGEGQGQPTYKQPSSPFDGTPAAHPLDLPHMGIMEGNPPAGEPATPVEQQGRPRYLRIGALPKWNDSGSDPDGMEEGMLKQSRRDQGAALREAEQEEAAAAPKRPKMLQEEQSKPRATYFALTGQLQEAASSVDDGTDMEEPLIGDLSVRSEQGRSQQKAMGQASGDLGQDARSYTEEMMEVEKKRELVKEAERQKNKVREMEREKQRQLEMERQAQLEFERLKERDMQREFERQRQRAFEREKQEMEERQQALEVQRQLEEAERDKQRELERQQKMEKEKQLEMERQRKLERERQREMKRQKLENERQLELQRERQLEMERQKMERERQLEMDKQRELERDKQLIEMLEKQRLKDLERKKEAERKQLLEQQKQREEERQRVLELEKQRLREKMEREQAEKIRLMVLEQETLRLRELEKERERQREAEKEMERERQRELDRHKQMEMERHKQLEMERHKQLEMERQKQREIERHKQLEMERQKQLEMERHKQLEMERHKQLEMERQKQLEMERHKQLEMERQKQLEMERQKQLEMERQKQLQKQLEMERQKQLERERQKQLEWERQKQLDIERQKQLDMERQKHLDMERQRRLDVERQELEKQRLRQREAEKERLRQEELERRQLAESEKQKQAERERQQILEMEKQRLRERAEKEEEKEEAAERMRLVARQQDAERQRIREKQRREQQEASPLKPKVLDLDSVFRSDSFSKTPSPRGDPSTRWKEPPPRPDETYRPAILDIDSFSSQTQPPAARDPFDSGFSPRSQATPPERDVSWRVPAQTPPAAAGSPVWSPFPQDPWELQSGEMSVDTPESQPRRASGRVSVEQLLRRQDQRPQQPPLKQWPADPLDSLDPFQMSPFAGNQAKSGASSAGLSSAGLSSAGLSSGDPTEDIWLPREPQAPEGHANVRSHRRSQGSQELNRMRSRSVSRRSAPSSSAVEASLSRMRSRSAHREQDRHSWVQQKQSTAGEEGEEEEEEEAAAAALALKDSDTPLRDTDSQYGTWETGLRTDDSLTPATPSSDSNLSPSPKKPSPSQTPGEHHADILDGLLQQTPSVDDQTAFPEAPAVLLDNSALRSKVQLGKKRGPRSRPSRMVRRSEGSAAAAAAAVAAANEEWLYRDSTEPKAEPKSEDSDSDWTPTPAPRAADSSPAVASQPQRVALFPGVDPSALKVQLKKRGESDSQTDGASPSQLSRSPKSPFLPRATRVLPPAGAKENGEEESPQWLKELKSKKRLSQYESET